MAKVKEAPAPTHYAIIFQGHNILRVPYTVKITVIDNAIVTIECGEKANLNIRDLCRKFEMKHPTNIEDVAGIIKLEMIKRNEYVREVRQ